MQVVNIHKRIINQPKARVSSLMKTLATKEDKVWPKDRWPAIKFKTGLKIGEKGGHGMIRYSIKGYEEGEYMSFEFLEPEGFNGDHRFEIIALKEEATEVRHSILMKTEGFLATFKWIFVIRWLHDALIENAFDTIENNFLETKKFTTWCYWVRLWRFLLKPSK
ncbi:hypothetical protein [Algibacter mikhailovii]|uniref:hypothetical protein n=1 Tax=Algibacter mikhailovii TaxID=425498 RepID=UPI002495633A|nr:hypothetical protein [Algibacter mikhailovii]